MLWTACSILVILLRDVLASFPLPFLLRTTYDRNQRHAHSTHAV